MSTAAQDAAAAAVDPDALADDLCALVRVPSATGDERVEMGDVVAVARALARLMARFGGAGTR